LARSAGGTARRLFRGAGLYDFLDEQLLVLKTPFGNVVKAAVNGSAEIYEVTLALGGVVRLPPYGFLVEAETFVALHARSWGGITYDAPVLFTLTSLDHRPLAEAVQVRVFHGFGDARRCGRGETGAGDVAQR
jgi:hypothetical protein